MNSFKHIEQPTRDDPCENYCLEYVFFIDLNLKLLMQSSGSM